MSLMVANLLFAAGICGLFYLDRDPLAKTSKALWIPVIWLFISGSRPVSVWLADLGLGGAPLQVESPEAYLDGSPQDRLVFIILLAAGLAILIFGKRNIGVLLRRNILLVVFFGYCLLSVLWSDFTFVAFKRWIKAVGDPLMIFIILSDPGGLSALKRVLSRTAFLLIPLSVLYIKYYPILGREYNIWSYLPSYTGVTVGKNQLGVMCLVFALGSLWRFLGALRDESGKERRRHLLAHGAVLAMAFWLFWMANSLTSTVCFTLAGSLMVAITFFKSTRKPVILHLMVLFMVCVPLYALFSGSGGGMVESLGRDSTLTGRTGIWKAVLSVSGNPLVGTGFESFWLGERLRKVWDMTMKGLQEAHNGYLEVYLNLGFIGLGFLVTMIVTGYKHAIAAVRQDPYNGSLALAFLLVAVVYNLSEAGFRAISLVWFFFLLAVTTRPEDSPLESVPERPIDFRAGFRRRTV
jgi:exopolysaccharide production protein ExoQ